MTRVCKLRRGGVGGGAVHKAAQTGAQVYARQGGAGVRARMRVHGCARLRQAPLGCARLRVAVSPVSCAALRVLPDHQVLAVQPNVFGAHYHVPILACAAKSVLGEHVFKHLVVAAHAQALVLQAQTPA